MPAAPPPTIRMSEKILSIGGHPHSVNGDDGAASLQPYAVDGNGAFKADTHSAKRATRAAADRPPKHLDATCQDGRRHGRAVLNRCLVVVDGKCDQCSEKVLDGEYGSAGMSDFRPSMASDMSFPVPSDVVIPNPSCPAATKVFL